MDEKQMTYAAVVMALIAVAYAFKAPKQPGEVAKASAVNTWLGTIGEQLTSLDMANTRDEYGRQLARLPGFYLGT